MCTIISESVHLCFSTYTVFLRVPELLGFLVRRCILKLTGESFICVFLSSDTRIDPILVGMT